MRLDLPRDCNVRCTTVSWCRSARISRCSNVRDRSAKRREWSGETTTEVTLRGRSRPPVTSMDAIRTVFLIRTGRGLIDWQRARPFETDKRDAVLGQGENVVRRQRASNHDPAVGGRNLVKAQVWQSYGRCRNRSTLSRGPIVRSANDEATVYGD